MKAKKEKSPVINPNPALSVEKDGTVLYSNEAGESLLHEWGVGVGEKLPSSIGDIVRRVISRNSPEKIEVKVGKSVHLVVFHPLSIQECVNISGFDISGQKELEEKPPESEEKYQDLFNLIEQAVQIGEIVFDENGQPIDNMILDVNHAYEKHSGLRREQVIGRGFKELLPIVEQTWLDRYGEVVRTGMGMHFEEYNSSLDRWFEVFASPMGGNRFIAVFSDITERKLADEALFKSEQHSRLVYETMLQGVVYQDASGKIISMNPAAERILGKTPAEFLGSSSVGEEHLTIREDDSPFPGLEHPAMVSLRTGQKVQDVVMGVYNPRENCYRWININAVPIFRTGEDKPFQVYTLFDDITKRKQEERRIRRYNRILKGINRIFSNVVQAKTEEELGNACLSVALELTGSEFGFINEMDTDGLLHDVAKSELGWERCFMYDKTGHRRPRGVFAVHGLYGSVINNEKSFFTNDPPSHPDSIGIPDGHPPITSFLGVPLVQEGKTIGLIAVANRENGYSCEQQEELEAIAPAVMQVLKRKREEQKRMNAEEALRESEERLRFLSDNLPDSAVYQYVLEPDGSIRFLYFSTGIERLSGVKVQDVLRDSSTLSRQVLPEYLERLFEAKARSVRELSDFEMEVPMRLPDGQMKWMRLHTRPRQLPDGRIIWNGVQIDITENKRVEEALRKSEEHYRMLFTNMTEGFLLTEIVYDKDGRPYDYRYLEANPVYELTHGIKKEELLGKTLLEVFPNTTTTTIKKFGEVALSGQSTTFEVFSQVVNKYIDVYAFSPEKGKLAAIVRDITARKKAEARLKETLDNLENLVKERTEELEEAYNSLKESERGLAEAQKMAHIGNWSWDIVTGELHWSEEMYRIFGHSPQEPYPTYKEFLSYIHPDDLEYVDNAAKKAMNGKPYSIDYRIVHANGEVRTVHMRSQVIFDKQNAPVQIKGIVQDITERKMAEEALERMEKVRIKEIHHRIKNNLQIISSLLDLQAEKFGDENVIEAFREGQNRVISMSLIHEELYKGGGTNTLDFSAYLKKLAENLFKTYNLSSKNISLSMGLEEDTFLDIDTAVPLGIIVNELVSNSLKHAFSEDKDGKIRIKLCREESNCDMRKSLFSLTISDDGKGLPDDLELESAESLGLQLVNILVDQLDGELELKRAQGTEFTIKFKVTEKI